MVGRISKKKGEMFSWNSYHTTASIGAHANVLARRCGCALTHAFQNPPFVSLTMVPSEKWIQKNVLIRVILHHTHCSAIQNQNFFFRPFQSTAYCVWNQAFFFIHYTLFYLQVSTWKNIWVRIFQGMWWPGCKVLPVSGPCVSGWRREKITK